MSFIESFVKKNKDDEEQTPHRFASFPQVSGDPVDEFAATLACLFLL